ncbi:MAG: DoxX family protein [Bryobacteraceae bacterium]
MDDTIDHPGDGLSAIELPGWKVFLAASAAVIVSALFLVAGVWKITDAPSAAARLAQARVPEFLSVPAAIGLGITETFAAVLILIPRFRRWGAWLISGMLLVFMVYVGVHYSALHGAECSCFPWIKRAIGPGFFVADGLMLCLALVAAWWSRESHGLRNAAVILGVVSVFAFASYGVAITRNQGIRAPSTISVEGKSFPLREGRVLIYFFDPECAHCLKAARRMAQLQWGETKIVGVPTVQPQFGPGFLETTGLRAVLSNDLEILKKTFPFPGIPAAVALENGFQKQLLTRFEDEEPATTLAKLGFVGK